MQHKLHYKIPNFYDLAKLLASSKSPRHVGSPTFELKAFGHTFEGYVTDVLMLQFLSVSRLCYQFCHVCRSRLKKSQLYFNFKDHFYHDGTR